VIGIFSASTANVLSLLTNCLVPAIVDECNPSRNRAVHFYAYATLSGLDCQDAIEPPWNVSRQYQKCYVQIPISALQPCKLRNDQHEISSSSR
jgi:hypothetical protein